MGDFKSKLPDLKELGSMTGKLFKDIKNSVSEIISDYQDKRSQEEQDEASESKPKAAKKESGITPTVKPAQKNASKKTDTPSEPDDKIS